MNYNEDWDREKFEENKIIRKFVKIWLTVIGMFFITVVVGVLIK